MGMESAELENLHDEALYHYSLGEFEEAAAGLQAILRKVPDDFEACLALGMAYFRLDRIEEAIAEGHRAEKLHPADQSVHTNLSLFYVKLGNKEAAEHHGLQARIAGWRSNMDQPADADQTNGGAGESLAISNPKPSPMKVGGASWRDRAPVRKPAPSPPPVEG